MSGRISTSHERMTGGPWDASDRVQTTYHDNNGAPAWLATIKRI
jgi:hypothetical protein